MTVDTGPTSRLSHAIWALGLLVLSTAFCSFAVYILPLSTAACADACDYDALNAAITTYFVLAPVIVIGAIIATFLLRRRGWVVLAAPGVGLVALFAVYAITNLIAQAALGL